MNAPAVLPSRKTPPPGQRSGTVSFAKFDGERHRANRERDRRSVVERENAALRAITVRVLRAYHTLAQDRRQRFEDAGFASPETFLNAMMTDLDPRTIEGVLAALFDGES